MTTPSTPIYILPGSTLQSETIEALLTIFRTMSALETIGVPPNLLQFHAVPASTHQRSSADEIPEYHLQNKQEIASVEPVIVLDDKSEGTEGTVLVLGFPREKDEVSLSDDEEEESTQTPGSNATQAQAQPYLRVRVVPTVRAISCFTS